MKQLVGYLLICLVFLSRCGDENQIKKSNGEDYFPLRAGFYQIYAVNEKIYMELNPPAENIYELKTEVVDSFANQVGGFTYVIYRSKRTNENNPWIFQEAWSARTNSQQIVLTEGNISYIPIALPVFKNKVWDANALNTLVADDYLIKSVGRSYNIFGGMQFSNALVIDQENESNNLYRDEREEVYARNVGLIFKKSIVLNYCDEVSCFGQKIINDGIEFEQVLIGYGQN